MILFLPVAICILRNSMQGLGDTKMPLVSSLIELAGKVLLAGMRRDFVKNKD